MSYPDQSPVPEDIEALKVGAVNPNPERHDGFSFVDRVTGLGHRILRLRQREDDPTLADADLVMFDEISDLTEPVPVIVPLEHLEEARPFRMFIKEHETAVKTGAIGAASIVVGVVGVSSLVVLRRKHLKKH